MREVNIPVPPTDIMKKALGYSGAALYLAAWWDLESDDCLIGNGRRVYNGNLSGFLEYVNSPNIRRVLQHFRLGSSETLAAEYLVLDLYARKVYIAQPHEANVLLREQWSTTRRFTLRIIEPEEANTEEELTNPSFRTPSERDVDQRFQEQEEAVETLRLWLKANSLCIN